MINATCILKKLLKKTIFLFKRICFCHYSLKQKYSFFKGRARFFSGHNCRASKQAKHREYSSEQCGYSDGFRFLIAPPVKLFLRLSSFFYPKLEIRFGVSSWSRIETSKTTFLKMNKEYYWSELYKPLTCKNKQKKITLFNILEKKNIHNIRLICLTFFFLSQIKQITPIYYITCVHNWHYGHRLVNSL